MVRGRDREDVVADRSKLAEHQKGWPFGLEEEETNFVPFAVDICETEDEFVVVGELPGVRKENLNIRLTENELEITGKVQVALDREEKILYREVPGISFRRTFTMSDAVDRDKVKAELKDGVLSVRLAKSEHIKPREIPISA